METKANYVVVGIFTVVILIAAFVVVFIISRMGENSNLEPLDIRIPGSVTGLGESSQVLFNGIRVGTVRRLILDETNPNMVIAKTEINATTPITRSTVATLGFQGLTGLAFIELKGGSINEPNLLQEAKNDGDGYVTRIDADPSTLNNLLATAQDIFTRANSVLSELEGFTKDVRGPLTETVKNTNDFSKTLSQNKENVQRIINNTSDMMTRLNTASQKVDKIMASLDTMLSPDNQNSVVVQAQNTLTSIQHAADTLNNHIAPIASNLERFSGQGLRNIEALVNDSRRSVDRIERAITDLEKNPQRLIYGGPGSVPQYNGRTGR